MNILLFVLVMSHTQSRVSTTYYIIAQQDIGLPKYSKPVISLVRNQALHSKDL